MSYRITWQFKMDQDDGAQSGRLFRPRLREGRYIVPRIRGYKLTAGPNSTFAVTNRIQATVHLGTKIQSFDSLPEPNFDIARFFWLDNGTGARTIEEQREPWNVCDIVVPYLFVGQAVNSATTSLELVLTGTMEYDLVDLSEAELLRLLLAWELDFKDRAAFRASLRRQTVRATGISSPYFLVRSTEEA